MVNIAIPNEMILQLIVGAFTAGALVFWVKNSINQSKKNDEKQDHQIQKMHDACDKMKEDVLNLQNNTMSRKENFRVFVSKEMLQEMLKNIDSTVNQVLEELKGRR
ncbi:DUF4047 domain-containing protein [Sulfurimonas sp.]|uniref:DUF4047 domain-containing protein n=1 Tax=Sulfurimonas sp. TaxID=2022749 RepID=UPI0025FC9B1C|nr:DUF4047 domain-containing protein [Sulfurimonas sp.]